jgi:hypothetical protein
MLASEIFSGAPSTSGSVFSMPVKNACELPSNSRMILEICQKGKGGSGSEAEK